MFFGYENEAKMRESNPVIAERLIQLATKSPMNVCTPGKKCVGGLPEGTRVRYIYDDGSEDYGREITKFRTEFKGHVFAWASE